MIKVCERCGEEYTPNQRTRNRQKYCSSTCGNRDRYGSVWSYICQNCGKLYETKFKERNTCCSRECGWEYNSKKQKVNKNCKCCNRSFLGNISKSDYCSDKCAAKGEATPCESCQKIVYGRKLCSDCRKQADRDAQYVRAKSKKKNKKKTCSYCGCRFVTEYGDKRKNFCSKECAREHWKTENPEKHKGSRAAQRHRRRARKYGNGEVESILPIEVHRKCKWHCGICGEKIDKNLEFPHPMSASVDHILPLSKGGTHTMVNLQSAHFICNSVKGNNVN